MTLDQFFEKLPRDGWRFDPSRPSEIVRIEDDSVCPWLFVSNSVGKGEDPMPLWGRIIKAADRAHGHDPALRARLLAHCGLKDTQ